jgi:hypothetical protein
MQTVGPQNTRYEWFATGDMLDEVDEGEQELPRKECAESGLYCTTSILMRVFRRVRLDATLESFLACDPPSRVSSKQRAGPR